MIGEISISISHLKKRSLKHIDPTEEVTRLENAISMDCERIHCEMGCSCGINLGYTAVTYSRLGATKEATLAEEVKSRD